MCTQSQNTIYFASCLQNAFSDYRYENVGGHKKKITVYFYIHGYFFYFVMHKEHSLRLSICEQSKNKQKRTKYR